MAVTGTLLAKEPSADGLAPISAAVVMVGGSVNRWPLSRLDGYHRANPVAVSPQGPVLVLTLGSGNGGAEFGGKARGLRCGRLPQAGTAGAGVFGRGACQVMVQGR